jgi:pimeloyl-ACP methyl ester carboxylesterase
VTEAPAIHNVRRGEGQKLLLIHGLGGSWRSWSTISSALSRRYEVIAVDLPGHGKSPAEPDSGTFLGLVRSVEAFIANADLADVDAVGSSMGARIVLELARRGIVRTAIALDPGGFWEGWERDYFRLTISASVRLLRGINSALPLLSRNAGTRSALLAQLSARPWALDPAIVAAELQSYVATPTFDALVHDLATGEMQLGPAAPGTNVVIGWGRQDRLCLPRQATRAQAAFPSAQLHWFGGCGHFPMWDAPEETLGVIEAALASWR